MKTAFLAVFVAIMVLIHAPAASQTQEHLAVAAMQFFDQDSRLNSEIQNKKTQSDVSSPSGTFELDILEVILLTSTLLLFGWTLYKWKWDLI